MTTNMEDTPPQIPPRKKKPPRDTRYDIYQFETNEEGFTMPEFFDKYSDKLPVFTMVTQGCLGCTDLETFSVEQTLFCNSFIKQTRVVARDAKSRTISIPEEYPLRFKVVISSNKVGKEQSLTEILSENKLPLQVQFSVPDDVVLRIDSDKRKAKDLTNLLLVKTYEEIFCLANGVYGKTLELNPIIVPLYLQDLQVSTVKGAMKMSDKEWEILYADLKAKLKDAKKPAHMGNREIAIYSDSLTDSDDHVYQYIEPTDYISFAHLSKENATDDEKYTIPYFHKRQEPQQKLKLDITDVSDRDGRKRPINRSISDTTEKQTPPELPPRTQSFMNRSARKLAERAGGKSGDKGEATPPRSPVDAIKGKSETDLSHITIKDLSHILERLRLEKYVDKFKRRQVDGEIAKELSEDILKNEFRMTEFEIIKFLKFTQTGHIPK